MKKILIILVALLFLTLPVDAYVTISGTVFTSTNGSRLPGVSVLTNGTVNATTNATGDWLVNGIDNGTTTLVYRIAGYTQHSNSTVVTNNVSNTTNNVTITIITPAVSAVTASSITKNSGTISWTVTAADNVNNNFVGNRLLYSLDSNLANGLFYTIWSNSTTSPSFTLSNLDVSKTYYYQVQTYNMADATYSATSNNNFVTAHGRAASTPALGGYDVNVAGQPGQQQIVYGSVPPAQNNKPKLLFVLVVAIVAIYFFWGRK